MFEKLKQNLFFLSKKPNDHHLIYNSYWLILVGIVLFGGFFAGPDITHAACSTGSLLTPTFYNCDINSVELKVSSNTFKIGDSVTFTITVNNNLGLNSSQFPFDPVKDRKTFQLGSNGKIVFSKGVSDGAGGVFNTTEIITSTAFPTAGTYNLTPSVIYSSVLTADQGNSTYGLVGQPVKVTVGEALSSGVPKLTLKLDSKGISPANPELVTASFSFNYSGGGDNIQAKALLYYCDFQGDEAVGWKAVSSGSSSFNCAYQTTKKDYRIFLKAVGNDNKTIARAEQILQITGNEANEGQQTYTQNNSGALAALINQIIGTLIGFIQELIYAIFFYLIAPLIQAMLSIRVYTDTFAAVIYPGWEVIRNICNIFFIVALIVIALATLFRVESYQFRHLIVQLILAALLVNFSLVIAQAILGLADTIQAQFLPSNVEVIRSLAKDLMVNTYRDVYLNNPFSDASFSGIVKPLFFLALALGSFAVFCAIGVFLVIRVVALWLLLLVSPAAYAAGALPATSSLRKQWWDNFLKYAFFTPIMAFFLNLTAVIANTYKTNPVLQEVTSGNLVNDLGGSNIAAFVFKVASNILLLVFLIASLKVADMAGIYGASAITSVAQKGIFAPFAAAGGGAKLFGGYLARKHNEITSKIRGHEEKVSFGRAAAFAVTNPVAFVKGLKKQSEERSHRAQAKAESVGLEVAEQRFSSPKAFFKGSYKINPHVLQHEKEEEDEQAKKLQNLSREEVARRAAQIFMMGDSEEDLAYKRGVIKLAMSKGYIDDIVQEAHKTEEGRKMIKTMVDNGWVSEDDFDWEYETDTNGKVIYDENGEKKIKKDANGNNIRSSGLKYNHNTRRAMYKAMFGVVTDSHGHETLKDHAAMRVITQEGEKEGMDTGHLEYMTDMRFNEKTGHFEFYELSKNDKGEWVSKGDERMAAAEIAKRDSRTQAKIAWHALMSSDGKDFSGKIYQKVAKAFVENTGFMQERTANMLVAGTLDSDRLKYIQDNFRETGELDIDETSMKRLEEMMEVDEAATAAVIGRFMNDTKGVSDRLFKAGGIKIKGKPPLEFKQAGRIAKVAAEKAANKEAEAKAESESKSNKQTAALAAAMKEAIKEALRESGGKPPTGGNS